MPLTNYQRRRIIFLHSSNESPAAIRRILLAEGVYTMHPTVVRTIRRFEETGQIKDRKKSGRPKTVPESHYRFIDEAMAENDELTASDLLDKLRKKFGDEVRYSKRTLARARQDLGWTFTTTSYCQAIREANKSWTKRLEWCQQRLLDNEQFSDVIFTDESSIQLESHRRKSFRKRSAPRKLKYRHKHPLKVHVWAGISKRGATSIVIFTGILTATRYAEILSASLIPFIRRQYPDTHRLYQDNDPKHTSRYVQGFFEDNDINWWKSPSESPDINCIEKVWGVMKCFLRDKVKPKTLGDLKAGIKLFWKRMTPEVCLRYVGHLAKVLPSKNREAL